ncbi:MAG: sulfite exporter TauE/SafE family protein [Planctomycetota bacterium]
MPYSASEIVIIAAIALVGGTVGGLLGLGGSIFIIPALTIAIGLNQHLYHASALTANIFVAIAATLRHRGRGTIRADVVPTLATAAALAATLGVLASNLIDPKPLAALFGAYLCYTALAELTALARRIADRPDPEAGSAPRRTIAAIGVLGGFASGLLGIGGGALMVPLLRKYAKLPMRHAVASSAAAMIAACIVGASAKNASIAGLTDASGVPLTLERSLALAAILAPCAAIGGSLGAALVYRVPVDAIRAAFSLLLIASGIRMILAALG